MATQDHQGEDMTDRFHSPRPATVISMLSSLLGGLTPGYFDHVGMHHLAGDAPAELVNLVASLHIAQEAVLALVEADAVRSAEGILHSHTEGPRP